MISSVIILVAMTTVGVNAATLEPLPWFMWPNITEAVVALNPDEIPYSKPAIPPPRRNSIHSPRSRVLSAPAAPRRPLHQPSTNVSDAALNLRFYVCCICIPEYSCVDGFASMPHYDPNDFDVNYAQCPFERDICCPVSDAPQECREVHKRSADLSAPPPIEAECECLHHELCPPDLVVKYNPEDTRHNQTSCSNELDVCCSISDIPPHSNDSPNTDILSPDHCVCIDRSICDILVHLLGITQSDYLSYLKNTPQHQTCSNSSQVCCSIPPSTSVSTQTTSAHRLLFQTPAVTYKDDGQCHGYFRSDQLPEVDVSNLRGDQSQFGEQPWVVLLEDAEGQIRGSGALIHPRAVLTVAHIFGEQQGGADGVRAILGEWDRSRNTEPLPHQTVSLERVLVHPNHRMTPSMSHDIAIAILAEPAVRQPHLQTVCLAESLSQVDTSLCTVAGWGTPSEDTQTFENIMKRITLPVVDRDTCQAALRLSQLGPDLVLDESAICAGGTGRPGTCLGDQGGPLVCPSFTTGRYLLVGALSGGAQCGAAGVPDIYTIFYGAVKDWVHEVLVTNFGEVDVPLPKVNETAANGSNGSGGVSRTAGGFYYDDNKCHGYETVDMNQDVSTLRSDQSQRGEFPWTVLLTNTSAGAEAVLGAGALIHPRVLITTAAKHARSSPSDLTVVLGAWDRHSTTAQGHTYQVERLVRHPQFNEAMDNDVMLVILAEEVQTAPDVQSICLARSFAEVDRSKCYAAGWGWPNTGDQRFEVIQKRIYVPIVEREACVEQLQALVPEFQLYETYFCGGGRTMNSVCGGDEGGPVVCPSLEGGQYLLVGGLSGGMDCGAENIPDIYKSYMDTTYDWIESVITEAFPTRPVSTNNNMTVANSSDTSNLGDDIAATASSVESAATNEQGGSSSTTPASSDLDIIENYSLPPEKLHGSFGSQNCIVYEHRENVSTQLLPVPEVHQSQFAEFPWVALLQTADGEVWGSGALIHSRIVLTTATRALNMTASNLRVVLGEWQRESESEPAPRQIIEVESITPHPQHDTSTGGNDIALILLKENASSRTNIQSICLTSSIDSVDISKCVVNGWGIEQPGVEQHSEIMKRVLKPILNPIQCRQTLGFLTGNPAFQIGEGLICAGGRGGLSTCAGDEGAPLACPSYAGSHHYILMGVLSGGFGCGLEGVPDFYSSVIHHKAWIDQTVAELTAEKMAGEKSFLEMENPTVVLNDCKSGHEESGSKSQQSDGGGLLVESEEAGVDHVPRVNGSFSAGGLCQGYRTISSQVHFVPSHNDAAQPDELPWMALMQSSDGVVLGPASLIHPRALITTVAALRGLSPQSLIAHLGLWDGKIQQSVRVKDIISPKAKKSSDVRILVLQDDVQASPSVQSICLSPSLEGLDTSKCVIASWFTEGPDAPPQLKRAPSGLLSQCPVQHQHPLARTHSAGPNVLCAVNSGPTVTCMGEEGGSLVCPSYEDGSYRLVGAVSEGSPCSINASPRPVVLASFTDSVHSEILKTVRQYFSETSTSTASGSIQSATRNDPKSQPTISVPQSVDNPPESDGTICFNPDVQAGTEFQFNPLSERTNDDQMQPSGTPWLAKIISCISQHDCVQLGAGALIHPQAVLTIASLIDTRLPVRLFVRVNQAYEGALGFEEVPVREVLLSPSSTRRPPGLENEHGSDMVALLVLDRPVEQSSGAAQTVCMMKSLGSVDRARCLTSGWTPSLPGNNQLRRTQTRIATSVLDQNVCKEILNLFKIRRTNELCGSRSGAPRICTEDIGAPLVCPRFKDGRYVLIGAMAHTFPCDNPMPELSTYIPIEDPTIQWVKSVLDERLLGVFTLAESRTKTDNIQPLDGSVVSNSSLSKDSSFTASENTFESISSLPVAKSGISTKGSDGTTGFEEPRDWLDDHLQDNAAIYADTATSDDLITLSDTLTTGDSILPKAAALVSNEDDTNSKNSVNTKDDVTPPKSSLISDRSVDLPDLSSKLIQNTLPEVSIVGNPRESINNSVASGNNLKNVTDTIVQENERNFTSPDKPVMHSILSFTQNITRFSNLKREKFLHHARDCLEEELYTEPSVEESKRPTYISASYSSIVRVRARPPQRLSTLKQSLDTPELKCQDYVPNRSASPSNKSPSSQYPFTATVHVYKWRGGERSSVVTGTGTLIHSRVLLTAASALARANVHTVIIRLGDTDLPPRHQERRAAKLVLHPRYDPTTHQNDLAIVILKEEVVTAANVQPLCFETSFDRLDISGCRTVGWDSAGNTLKTLPSPLLDGQTCERTLQGSELTPFLHARQKYLLHQSFVCARPISSDDLCLSMPGAALVCPSLANAQVFRLVGVQPWGDCAAPSSVIGPTVYSAVIREACGGHPAWIRKTMQLELGMGTTQPKVKRKVSNFR